MNPNMDREVRVTGIARQAHHQPTCSCEDCGPAFVMVLSRYEAERLRDHLLEVRQTGDWNGQLIFKLNRLLDTREGSAS